jgi:NADH-quinone oxidoreductase subunit N
MTSLILCTATRFLMSLLLLFSIFGKFYILVAGIEAARWLLVALLVLNSALALFYYLRLVVTMYAPMHSTAALSRSPSAPSASWLAGIALTALLLFLLWLGLYQRPFLAIIRTAVVSLT